MKREVTQGFTTYVDASGARRFALAGDTVDVHADDVKRFDSINGGAPEPSSSTAPEKQARPAKKD